MGKVQKPVQNALLPLLQQRIVRNFSTQTSVRAFCYKTLRIQTLAKPVNKFLNFNVSNFSDLYCDFLVYDAIWSARLFR